MKLLKLITITTCVLTTGLTACQKKDTTVATTEEVQINVTSPKEGSIYKKGDTVNIVASISSITQMHGYIITIKNMDKGTTVYETEGHTHGDNISVAEQWVNTLDEATDLQLELTGVITHDENIKNIKIGFKSQP